VEMCSRKGQLLTKRTKRFIKGIRGYTGMLQYVVWGITFLTLWLTIVWLNFLFTQKSTPKLKRLPKITFGIPVWNEEKTVVRTIQSLLEADYPSHLKEIIVVNDGSTDGTRKVVEKFVKAHPEVVLINKENGGKASAVNDAIDRATGEFFAQIDADSRIEPNALKQVIPHFADKKVGAVISRIRVDEPKNFFQRMQRFEYVMSSMTRFIMNNFGTLTITHGALSTFRTSTLRKVGGFVRDKENITEDFEIALRLRKNGYAIVMEPNAISYTHVPSTLRTIWRQRIRWSRGYIYNMWQYRGMVFDTRHGLLGTFQLPVNVLAVALLIFNVSLISYDSMNRLSKFVFRSFTIPDYFFTQITSFPSLREFILARNVQVMLPVFVCFMLGLYLIVFAHRMFNERLQKNVLPFIAYTLVMPYFSTVNWVSSIAKEVRRTRRTWR